MYYVYAVYNQENNKVYVGQTKNLEERLNLHNSKLFKGSFTSRFSGHWELIFKEKVNTRKEALIRERQLKSYRGREFIKKLIIPL
ncbi:MAG: GIY-YIG nuclease family protein [Patescibacteria group bacterium]